MTGEKEGDNRRITEQPRLQAADGGQIAWPEATAPQEISIFLREVGTSKLLSAEKELKREQQRTAMQNLRQKRRNADPEGFRAGEAAKMRQWRAGKEQDAESQEASDTKRSNSS